jgi:hypothetical protein
VLAKVTVLKIANKNTLVCGDVAAAISPHINACSHVCGKKRGK